MHVLVCTCMQETNVFVLVPFAINCFVVEGLIA